MQCCVMIPNRGICFALIAVGEDTELLKWCPIRLFPQARQRVDTVKGVGVVDVELKGLRRCEREITVRLYLLGLKHR